MIAITFLFSAAGVQSWTAPRDLKFIGGSSNTGWFASVDPDTVSADISAPGANGIRTDILAFGSAATSTRPALSLTIPKGQVVFVGAPAQGNVMLYFA